MKCNYIARKKFALKLQEYLHMDNWKHVNFPRLYTPFDPTKLDGKVAFGSEENNMPRRLENAQTPKIPSHFMCDPRIYDFVFPPCIK